MSSGMVLILFIIIGSILVRLTGYVYERKAEVQYIEDLSQDERDDLYTVLSSMGTKRRKDQRALKLLSARRREMA